MLAADRPNFGSRRRHVLFPVLSAALLPLLAVLSGCGLLGGSDSGGNVNSPLEQSSIKVGVLSTIDIAPLKLAIDKGYFAAEGLNVQMVIVASGPASVSSLTGGDIQVALSSYVPFFVAQSSGAVNFKIVADCSEAAPGTVMLMTSPRSQVKDVRQLAGRKIAVSGRGTISDTLVMSTLKTEGVDYSGIQWVEMPFPDMASRLAAGDVDAALMVPPFITQAEKSIGATPLFDAASGPTAGIAIGGYAAAADFVAKNPKTVAAFQRGLARASSEAADRSKIEPLLPEIAKIDADTAALTTVYTYRATPDPTRLQRVADLLLEFGVLKKPFAVASMIAPQPAV